MCTLWIAGSRPKLDLGVPPGVPPYVGAGNAIHLRLPDAFLGAHHPNGIRSAGKRT